MPRPIDPMTPSVPVVLPDVLAFMQLLWAVVHGVESRSKRMRSEIGVTGRQRLVLRIVGLFPHLSAGDLAAVLHVHPSTLTGLLQRLIAQGLLRRVVDERDRRRVLLSLTTRGSRINTTHAKTVEAAVGAALRGVTAGQRAATREVLLRIAEALGADEVVASEPPPRSGAGSTEVRRPFGKTR
jgi:MarR family transcriptional regulator, organic hydroperoxide resistance regulator